jgi:hypothetical protein
MNNTPYTIGPKFALGNVHFGPNAIIAHSLCRSFSLLYPEDALVQPTDSWAWVSTMDLTRQRKH